MRDLSLHILDIVQNSINANASVITVHVGTDTQCRNLLIEIVDNGFGMDKDFLKKALDPFTTSRTTRKIGLGIPLLKESAQKCGGKFNIYSEKNIGTKVSAIFAIKHIDRLPIGDISETIVMLIYANTNIRFILTLDSNKGDFKLDTEEVNGTLKGLDIKEFAVLQWLKEYIDEGIKNIFGGVLNEVDS